MPFTITGEDMYEVFGKYGAIRQIRLGVDSNRGTAFVVFEEVMDVSTNFYNEISRCFDHQLG